MYGCLGTLSLSLSLSLPPSLPPSPASIPPLSRGRLRHTQVDQLEATAEEKKQVNQVAISISEKLRRINSAPPTAPPDFEMPSHLIRVKDSAKGLADRMRDKISGYVLL